MYLCDTCYKATNVITSNVIRRQTAYATIPIRQQTSQCDKRQTYRHGWSECSGMYVYSWFICQTWVHKSKTNSDKLSFYSRRFWLVLWSVYVVDERSSPKIRPKLYVMQSLVKLREMVKNFVKYVEPSHQLNFLTVYVQYFKTSTKNIWHGVFLCSDTLLYINYFEFCVSVLKQEHGMNLSSSRKGTDDGYRPE